MSTLHGLTLKSLILIFLFYVFKVLILEPTKIYQPSYLSINNEVEEKTISIWHVLPDDEVNGNKTSHNSEEFHMLSACIYTSKYLH